MHLEITSIFPAVLACGVAGLTALAVVRHSAFYAGLLATSPTRRYDALDGLRGGLAIAVFLSHGVSSYYDFLGYGGFWPPSTFYRLCGSIPVSLFFMITGLLFWDKAITAPGRIDLKRFYLSRLRRIAPMYWVCVLGVFAIVGFRTGWMRQVPPLDLLRSVAAWLGLGLFGQPDVNGLLHTRSIDPALWTLRFEWLFYLALPVLSFCATPRRFPVIVLTAVAVAPMGTVGALILAFPIGMCVAQVRAGRSLPCALRSKAAAIAALILAIPCLIFTDGDYSLLTTFAAAPLFVVVAAGNDLGGLLSSRVMRFLGLISYSIYVSHRIVLYLSLQLLDQYVPVMSVSAVAYWTMVLASAAVIVGLSATTYRWVEYPFLQSRPVTRPVRAARHQI